MTADLDDAEIARITFPLVRAAAQIRALRRMGFHVIVKPNGRPMVSRANFEAVTNPAAAQTPAGSGEAGQRPDSAALIDLCTARKVKYGDAPRPPRKSA